MPVALSLAAVDSVRVIDTGCNIVGFLKKFVLPIGDNFVHDTKFAAFVGTASFLHTLDFRHSTTRYDPAAVGVRSGHLCSTVVDNPCARLPK